MAKRERTGISDAALAAAREMRRFDSALTDEQIVAIARRIHENRAAARALDIRSAPLANADEPVTRFVLGETDARA